MQSDLDVRWSNSKASSRQKYLYKYYQLMDRKPWIKMRDIFAVHLFLHAADIEPECKIHEPSFWFFFLWLLAAGQVWIITLNNTLVFWAWQRHRKWAGNLSKDFMMHRKAQRIKKPARGCRLRGLSDVLKGPIFNPSSRSLWFVFFHVRLQWRSLA